MQRGRGTWRVKSARGYDRQEAHLSPQNVAQRDMWRTRPRCPCRRTPRTLAASAVTNIAQTYLIDSNKRYVTIQIHCYLRTCSIISDLIKRCIISKNYSHTTLLCVHTQLEMDIKRAVPGHEETGSSKCEVPKHLLTVALMISVSMPSFLWI